jgi:hypothetical protein
MAAVRDRDRPLQALSLKRIIKAVEDHWSEPAVLAGMLHELRFRLEPEAAFQARSIARRLSTLQYQLLHDAGRMAEESQAAADALAIVPLSVDETADEEESKPGHRRRWLALAAFGGAAALATAVWLLRPEAKALETSDPAGPGLSVTASGRVAPLHGQAGAARPSSSLDREQPRRIAANEKALPAQSTARPRSVRDTAGSPDTVRPDPAPAADDRGPGAPPGSPALREDAAGGASARPARPPRLPLRPELASAPTGAAPAEAGVEVAEAALDCYRTDRNPEGCAASVTASRASPVRAPQDSGSTADAGGVDPVDAAASARLPSSRTPYLGPTGTESAPRVGPPRAPLVVATASPAIAGAGLHTGQDQRGGNTGAKKDADASPQCVGSPPMGRIVFVLDGTLSMGLPLDVDGALEDRLDDAISRHEAEARRQYRALLAEPGPKRITRAREAFTAAVQDLPDWVDLGLVVFQECKDVRKIGTFEAARRGRAIDYIRSLIPHGRTPIAAGLRHAADMLGDGPSSIVLLTDGRESCSGDPCAVAAEIHRAHPDTPVHVVDITGQAKAECIAEITGGKTYTPAAADDLAEVLHNAFRGTDARCSRTEE